MTTDPAGNLYIADTANNRVQEVAAATGTQRGTAMTKNDIYTIAGSPTGTAGVSGDGGPASQSLLDAPAAIASDSSGDVYIADGTNNRDQEIPAASGTEWAQSMTAGNIYTAAGSPTGTAGESGDGGSASSALMDYATGVSVDPSGNLYVTDMDSNRVREITATTAITIATPPGAPSALSPTPGGITVTQPGGAQVTFQPESGGNCTAPYQKAGGYCALPQDISAALTYSSGSKTYTFTPSSGSATYTYAWTGELISETDTAGNTLSITYGSPAPGLAVAGDSSQVCPSTATSCETITSASGRALVIGSNGSGLVTSATDPMGREWTYGYNNADDLTSVADPMGHETTYAYGQGSNGPLQASDLLTITDPNAQPGGPDAGDATVNVYNSSNEVTSQTDPMGRKATFNYCINATAGNCMDAATGDGFVSVTDPEGNVAVYDYDEGTLAAQSEWTGATGATLTAESDNVPDTTVISTSAGGASDGSLLDTATFDGDQDKTTYSYDAAGDVTSSAEPTGGGGTPAGTAAGSAAYTSASQNDVENCVGTAQASPSGTCAQDPGPGPVTPGGVITPPPSAPPIGLAYTLYDTDGNELYSTTGVYEPGATSAAYSQTTYQLFKGNSVTLPGTSGTVSCTYSPPSMSLPCAAINADGVVTQLEYDAWGDLISSSIPDGNGSQASITTDAYNGDGQQLTEVAPDGNLSGANVGNFTTSTVYNADGEQTSVTAGGGSGYTDTPRTTSYGYDADGNQTTVEDARGYTTTTAYNADDEADLVTDPDGDATLTCYDGAGNAVQTVPAVGVAANGLTPASCPVSYPAGYSDRLASDATTTSYDGGGNQTAVTTPAPAGQTGSETTTYTYDGDGNQVMTTAPAATTGGTSEVTVDTYNLAGELASETSGYGTSAASTTSFCYNLAGQRTSVVPPDGNTGGVAPCETSSPWVVSASADPSQAAYQTTSSYDSVGALVSTTSPASTAAPNGTTWSYTYDPAGHQLTSTDADGVTTTVAYTPLAQASSVSYSGSSAHAVSYGYDADGNLVSVSDATGSSSFVFDPFSEVSSATNGAGQTIGYAYDADGDTTGITYPLPSTATWASTDTVSYGYDKADELTSMSDFNGHQVAISNTADGLPTAETLGSSGDTLSTTYDATDEPSAITLKNSSSTLQSFTYTNAPDGDIMNETDVPSSSHSPAAYSYDSQGRIVSMTPGSGSALAYAYDTSGNPTTLPAGAAASYNNAGELTSSTLAGTTTSYSYDADGNRTTATQGSSTLASGTWNGQSELTTYSNAAADMTSATYNGGGLRSASTITPAGKSAITQDYVWNTAGGQQQLLMDSANAYIYVGDAAPAEQVNLATGAATYLVTDYLASVRGTVNSAGTLTGTTSYDAWGNPLTAGGLTASTPFGYAGGYTDPDGLIYLIDRYYDPATGQFISVDPDVSQTDQPYQYASDNPISQSDPSGDTPVRTLWNYNVWGEYVGNENLTVCGSINWVIGVSVCKSSSDVIKYADDFFAAAGVFTTRYHNVLKLEWGDAGFKLNKIPNGQDASFHFCDPSIDFTFKLHGKAVKWTEKLKGSDWQGPNECISEWRIPKHSYVAIQWRKFCANCQYVPQESQGVLVPYDTSLHVTLYAIPPAGGKAKEQTMVPILLTPSGSGDEH